MHPPRTMEPDRSAKYTTRPPAGVSRPPLRGVPTARRGVPTPWRLQSGHEWQLPSRREVSQYGDLPKSPWRTEADADRKRTGHRFGPQRPFAGGGGSGLKTAARGPNVPQLSTFPGVAWRREKSKSGHGPDAGHAVRFEETGADRTRVQSFLPGARTPRIVTGPYIDHKATAPLAKLEHAEAAGTEQAGAGGGNATALGGSSEAVALGQLPLALGLIARRLPVIARRSIVIARRIPVDCPRRPRENRKNGAAPQAPPGENRKMGHWRKVRRRRRRKGGKLEQKEKDNAALYIHPWRSGQFFLGLLTVEWLQAALFATVGKRPGQSGSCRVEAGRRHPREGAPHPHLT
eukprot:gene25010-biopygen7449